MMIFDTKGFVPRIQCGEWTDLHLFLVLLGDISIAVSYYLILLFLYFFHSRIEKRIVNAYIVVFFICFIFLCGTTHLLDVLMYVWPAYRLKTIFLLLTGAVSILTLVSLPNVLDYYIEMKSPDELRKDQILLELKIYEAEEAQKKLRSINMELTEMIKKMESKNNRDQWVQSATVGLEELKHLSARLRGGK